MRSLIKILVLSLFVSSLSAQDFSNRGKDFWVGYGNHIDMSGGNAQDLKLYLTSTVNANVQCFLGSSATPFFSGVVVANQNPPTSVTIPKSGANDARLNVEGVSSKGIHVVSDQPVVAYAHLYQNSVSAATLLFPTNTLGRSYTALTYKQFSDNQQAVSFCFAIATEDNTTIQVTLPAGVATQTHLAGTTFTQTLNKGQVLNLMGQAGGPVTFTWSGGGSKTMYQGADLTGTKIESISSGPNGCKPIAVFAGSSKITIVCSGFNFNGGNTSGDNLYQQMFPQAAWGRRYITIPTLALKNNIFRIVVKDPTTVVKRNNVTLTGLINNTYYEYFGDAVPPASSGGTTNPTVDVIDADKPVLVAQYISSRRNCGNYASIGPNNNGDPEMIILSPVEQSIDNATVYSSQYFDIDTSYINVAIKTTGVSNFKLDGTTRVASFKPVPANTAYSYAQFQVTNGLHKMTADSGFNAICYGYGDAESYGYNAGANAKDLYQFLGITNPLSPGNSKACKGTPTQLSITLPYPATSLVWDFSNNPNISPNTTITNNSPVPDSTYVLDNRTLYVYRLPSLYTFTSTGTYTIKVTANNPTPDGCSGTQVLTFDVPVQSGPKANFSYTFAGCASDSARFTDLSTDTVGRFVAKWLWDFGDATSSTLQNPAHVFGSGGTYNVKLRAINDVGCFSDSIKQVAILGSPVVKFGISQPRCTGKPINFTDTSTISSGTLVKWYWDYGDGTADTVLNNSPRTHIYTTFGTYTITLQVENSTGCRGTLSKTITVSATPVPDFTMPAQVCLPLPAVFQNTTTIASGGFVDYLWNFGDGGTSTDPNPSHVYTGSGPFNVTLTATSSIGCSEDTMKVLTTVYNAPTAAFSVVANACIADSIQFTDQSTPVGNITNWDWNFGDGNTSTLQNPKHKWTAPGTYTVSLTVAVANGCYSTTVTKQVIVNAMPLANFTFTSPVCATKALTFTNTSTSASGAITEWSWNFGDGNTSIKTTGAPFNYTYALGGTYTVTLTVKSDKGCTSTVFSQPVTVRATPQANFTLPGNLCIPTATATFANTTTINDGTLAQVTYSWDFGDGSPLNTQTSPTHTFTGVGPYSIKLTATSNNGCTHDTTKQITTIFARPTATFTNTPVEVCLRDSMQFNATSNAPGSTVASYNWDFGNGSTSALQNPKYAWSTAGSFTVQHWITSAADCRSDTMTKTITVNAAPVASISTPGIRCAGSSISFTSTGSLAGSGTITEWHWDFGDGGTLVQTSSGPATHTFVTAGTYTVTLWIKNSKGCISATAPSSVTINPNPVSNFTATNACIPTGTVQFTNTSSITPGSVTGWLWDFGDATPTGTGPNPSHAYAAGGAYSVKLTATSAAGCTKDTTKIVTVTNVPTAKFGITNENSLCSNVPVTLTDSSKVTGFGSVNKLEIFWDYLNNPTVLVTDNSPAANKTYTNKYPGFGTPLTKTYRVLIRAYSGSGCMGEYFKDITLNAAPQAQFTAKLNDVCEEATPFVLSGGSDLFGLPGGVPTYSGPGVSLGRIFSPAVAGPGTHRIRFTITAGNGCSSFADTTIKVNPTPVINAGPDRFVLEGDDIQINTVGSGAVSWLWTPNTFLVADTVESPTSKKPTRDILYKVLATSADGCKATDEVLVKLVKDFRVPNTFTPNGDGINDKWLIENLSLYPTHRIQVFNRYGQAVYESKDYTDAWDGTYKGKELPAGTYYYVIELGTRKPKVGYVTVLK